MKSLVRFGAVVAAVAVSSVVVGLLLPSRYEVERSVVIDASPEQVHGLVGDLDRWGEWEPWTELDPTIETTLGATTAGVGATQSWTGDSGDGALTFTACDPRTGVVYDLLLDGGEIRSVGSITYDAADGGTTVTWVMAGDSGMNLIGRYFGLMMDAMVGPAFERGLSKLEERVEALPTDA